MPINIGLGNFHKTLPHDPDSGLVDANAYRQFEKIANKGGDFDQVPQSPAAAKLFNPQAGWAHDEQLGPNPADMHMPEPPLATSDGTAAEMTELYWMAALRDKPFSAFTAADADVSAAIAEIQAAYARDRVSVVPGKDVPSTLSLNNIFRSGLPGEDKGPLVSQFLLQDIAFGTQFILQKQFPYKAGRDYLTNWNDWLAAQNTGFGPDGKDYPADNDYGKDPNYFDGDAYTLAGLKRIRNMRDLARFVNKDALHQAYFNAALLLSNWGAPVSPSNPYRSLIKNQRGFATFGTPHLLAQVSEVAARALRVVWRQKWGVYRRLRPQGYGGLMESQFVRGNALGLPAWVATTQAAQRIKAKNGNFLLPIAFTAGSPTHPSYGAGHATVAGACVTMLKAWFDESAKLSDVVAGNLHPITRAPVTLVMPDVAGSDVLPPYGGSDLTVGGELNKLAANVALGRSMGGVHWRTDNTRSLRLGEHIATIIMRRECRDYHEKPSWCYTNFDGNLVTLLPNGKVTVANDLELERFYNQLKFAPHKAAARKKARAAGA